MRTIEATHGRRRVQITREGIPLEPAGLRYGIAVGSLVAILTLILTVVSVAY